MQIEARGRQFILREIYKILSEKLQSSGYSEGLGVQFMADGNLMNYTKENRIVCVQLTEESEQSQTILTLESEAEVPELYEIWDEAMIEFCRKTKQEILNFAMNKQKVEQGIR